MGDLKNIAEAILSDYNSSPAVLQKSNSAIATIGPKRPPILTFPNWSEQHRFLAIRHSNEESPIWSVDDFPNKHALVYDFPACHRWWCKRATPSVHQPTADDLLMEANHTVLIHFFLHCLDIEFELRVIKSIDSMALINMGIVMTQMQQMDSKWTQNILSHSNDVNIKQPWQTKLRDTLQNPGKIGSCSRHRPMSYVELHSLQTPLRSAPCSLWSRSKTLPQFPSISTGPFPKFPQWNLQWNLQWNPQPLASPLVNQPPPARRASIASIAGPRCDVVLVALGTFLEVHRLGAHMLPTWEQRCRVWTKIKHAGNYCLSHAKTDIQARRISESKCKLQSEAHQGQAPATRNAVWIHCWVPNWSSSCPALILACHMSHVNGRHGRHGPPASFWTGIFQDHQRFLLNLLMCWK